MKTISLILLLLIVLSSFNNKISSVHAERQGVTQDTTTAKIWRQRAEAATLEALTQKRLAEKMAADRVELMKKLKECEAKNKK